MEKSKLCSNCTALLNISQFSKDNTKRDGLCTQCRKCKEVYNKKYREANSTILKQKAKEYRNALSKEEKSRKAEWNKEYRRKNREYLNKQDREYWYRNRDTLLKKKKEYYIINKDVISKRQKKYYAKNIEAFKQYRFTFYREHKKQILERQRQYYQANKKTILARVSEYGKANVNRIHTYQKKYRLENSDELREKKNNYVKKRRATDIEYRLRLNLRSRVCAALRGLSKSTSSMKLLGCTIKEYRKHIRNHFTDGMSWEALMAGEIHVDHIIPVSVFNLVNPLHQQVAFHWSNTYPMWSTDNLKKKAYMPKNFDLNTYIKHQITEYKIGDSSENYTTSTSGEPCIRN